MPHPPICKLLLELVARIFQALASSLQVIYRDAQVAEAFVGLRVAIGDFVVRIVFGAVIVCELDDAFSISPVVAVRNGFGTVICEEVKVKFGVRVW